MRLYFDTDLRQLISGPGYRQIVNSLTLTRGDSPTLEIQFIRSGTVIDPEPALVWFCLKERNKFDGEYLVLCEEFTKTNEGTEDDPVWVWIGYPNLNTNQLNEVIGYNPPDDTDDKASVTVTGEIGFSRDDKETSSLPINVTVRNDLYRGDESAPEDAESGAATAAALRAEAAAADAEAAQEAAEAARDEAVTAKETAETAATAAAGSATAAGAAKTDAEAAQAAAETSATNAATSETNAGNSATAAAGSATAADSAKADAETAATAATNAANAAIQSAADAADSETAAEAAATLAQASAGQILVEDEDSDAFALDLAHNGKLLRCTAADPVAIEVPAQASAAWDANSQILIQQAGAGQVEVHGDTGVTVTSSTTLKTRTQYSVIILLRTGEDTWTVFGDLE
ncbi:hypothetical protein OpiT1DRAFT_05605 [Opitutaceae bacterium TAV1]|nr:hypothetical protein OpiT1DRAFT_05605 [Opitutaceae bacterium TAV1]